MIDINKIKNELEQKPWIYWEGKRCRFIRLGLENELLPSKTIIESIPSISYSMEEAIEDDKWINNTRNFLKLYNLKLLIKEFGQYGAMYVMEFK